MSPLRSPSQSMTLLVHRSCEPSFPSSFAGRQQLQSRQQKATRKGETAPSMARSCMLMAAAILSLAQAYSISQRNGEGIVQLSRRQWLGNMIGLAVFHASSAHADDVEEPMGGLSAKTYSIEKCATASKGACVSTANVKNLDLYLPPWTFDQSPEEAMARLKGAVLADPGCTIVDQDGSQYLKVEAERNDLFGSIDSIVFVINDKDHVVFFRSSTMNNENKDFGFNKKRLGEIRKRAGIFGLMGDSMMTADNATDQERGYGPLGQLKAFYGLQSGGGFEDVVLE